jgi:hypothetical protein
VTDSDARVWLEEDGIVRIEYPQNFNLTLQVMQAIELTTCLAIIVKSFFTRAMAKLFMKFHKPPYPARVFNDEKAALAWLGTFLQDVARVSGKHQ